VLLAKATVWPAWTQLLHPLATIIAKSKLLVLPAYPAAWPQAKKHAFVQATFRFCRYVATLHVVQKTGYRYRQTERAATDAAMALRHSADRTGLPQLSGRLLDGLNDLAARSSKGMRAIATGTVRGLSRLPLAGPIIRRYEAHYGAAAEQESPQKLSERIKGLYERWSTKLSAEYYEDKDVATVQAATSQAATSPVAQSHLVQSHGAAPVTSPPVTPPPPARPSSINIR